MAAVLLAAAGSAIGGAIAPGAIGFLGLTGSSAGWLVGSLLGGLFTPTQKSVGPQLDNLKVSGSAYGATLPYIEGHPRLPCQVIAASDKRPIPHTQRSGSKGGGGSQVTTFTYEVDVMLCFTSVSCEALLKVFSGGDLVLNFSTSADGSTVVASAAAPQWDSITFLGGDPTQLPHPDYEALVGAENAPAYRDRACIWIKSMKLGNSGQLQNITAEIARTASIVPAFLMLDSVSGVDDVSPAFQAAIDGGTSSDWYSTVNKKFGSSALAQLSNQFVNMQTGAPSFAARGRLNWPLQSNEDAAANWTMDAWVYVTSYPSSGDTRDVLTLGPYGKLLYDSDGRLMLDMYKGPTEVGSGLSVFWVAFIPFDTGAEFADIGDGNFPTVNKFQLLGRAVDASTVYGEFVPMSSRHPTPLSLNTWVHVGAYRYEGRHFSFVSDDHHEHGFLGADFDTFPTAPFQYHTAGILPFLQQGYGSAQYWYYPLSVATSKEYERLFKLHESNDPKLTFFVVSNPGHLVDAARYSKGALFVPGSTNEPYDIDAPPEVDSNSLVIYAFDVVELGDPTEPTIADVVGRLCLESGVPADQFDASDIADIPTPVHALTINQISTARAVIEMLMPCYFFESVLRGDVLYFRKRGAAPVVTIPYADLGWSARGQSSRDIFPINNGDDLTLPVQVGLVFSDITSDHQTDTQYSDRVGGVQGSISIRQLPLGLTPAEAYNIANAYLTDAYVALTTSKISLGLAYSRYEATDVALIVAKDGSQFRMRFTKKDDSSSVLSYDTVLDDATVFTQLGLTVGGVGEQTVVLPLPDSFELLLDIPALRDADAGVPGIYDAIKGETAQWRSADLFESTDAVTFNYNQTITAEAVFGLCTTTLGDWDGGPVFDEMSSVIVNVGRGQLSSSTYDALLLDPTLNGFAIGVPGRWELGQYRDVLQLTEETYRLSGLLRGRRGTEWAMVDHESGERFVALGTQGMRFLQLQVGDLARERYYKIASAGQKLNALPIDAITPLAVNLKPFAPTYLQINRDDPDWVLSWLRRTRMSVRVGGPAPAIVPLGEASESYLVEIFDGVDVVRSVTVGEPRFEYTAVMRADDFGSPLPTDLHYRVRMISATVGPGYPADFEG